MPNDPPAAFAAPPTLHIRGAHLSYRGEVLFDDLNLDVPGGAWTCLLGLSGVGKSSLLRLIAGLAGTSAAGSVSAANGGSLLGRVAYMAQSDLLLPWLSARDNVVLGARLRTGRVTAGDRERAHGLLSDFGLASFETCRPAALSGGMRQRVALARTLFEDRPVVLMDEPFSSVDAITRIALQDLAARRLAGRTVLMVTHDPMEALRLAHSVLVMAGRPARITARIEPPGPPPRPVGDPRLTPLQGELLKALETARLAA